MDNTKNKNKKFSFFGKKTDNNENAGTKPTSPPPSNIVYEKLHTNENFDIFKIRKPIPSGQEVPSNTEFIIAGIFKVKKVTRPILEVLNDIIALYNQTAVGLYLDVTKVDTIATDVLEYNADMIKNLERTSKFRRVTICGGKFQTLAFKALMKIKKPKILTKVFDQDEEAIAFALDFDSQIQ